MRTRRGSHGGDEHCLTHRGAQQLLSGKPMFPGSSTLNQLKRILEAVGWPSEEDVQALGSPFAETMMERIPRAKRTKVRYLLPSWSLVCLADALFPLQTLSDLFPTASVEALDLLQRLLRFNPKKVITWRACEEDA